LHPGRVKTVWEKKGPEKREKRTTKKREEARIYILAVTERKEHQKKTENNRLRKNRCP